MKKNSVAKNGKCFFQVLPTIALPTSFSMNCMPYSIMFWNMPWGTRLMFLTNANMMTRSRMADTIIQKVYWVTPVIRSPTTGME